MAWRQRAGFEMFPELALERLSPLESDKSVSRRKHLSMKCTCTARKSCGDSESGGEREMVSL